MLRRYRISLRSTGQQKCVLLIALVITIVLINTLTPLRFGLDTRKNPRKNPRIVEDRPRYLYHSSFRANPDHYYEKKLRNELRDLEIIEEKLRDNATTSSTLWQIMLGRTPGAEQRGEDSILFEEKNSDWEYMVWIYELLQSTHWANRANVILDSS